MTASANGMPPLIVACITGHAEIAAKLIDANADVNQVDKEGNGTTPLYIACKWGHAEVVAKLLAANADVNQARDGGVARCARACRGCGCKRS